MNIGKFALDVGLGIFAAVRKAIDHRQNGRPLVVRRYPGTPPHYAVEVSPGSHRRLFAWLMGNDLPRHMLLTLNGAGPFEFRTRGAREQFARVYQFAAIRAR